jgi:hypothetical protein
MVWLIAAACWAVVSFAYPGLPALGAPTAQVGGQPAGQAAPAVPALAVTGRGEVSARPDRATIRLGTSAQRKQAAEAQAEVNRVMQEALKQIKGLGVAEENITTAGLSLYPVYSNQYPRPGQQEPEEPRVIGYRASNTIQVQLENLDMVGQVIDAGISAGANQLEGLTFELKNDTRLRLEALRIASREARAKAGAIAEAMEVRLDSVLEIVEGGVNVIPPPMPMMRGVAMAQAEAATPISPGRVDVEATVTIRYRIAPRQ